MSEITQIPSNPAIKEISHTCIHEHDLGKISQAIETINDNIKQIAEIMKAQTALSVKVDTIERKVDNLDVKVNSLELNGANFNGKWKWVEKAILAAIGVGFGIIISSSNVVM